MLEMLSLLPKTSPSTDYYHSNSQRLIYPKSLIFRHMAELDVPSRVEAFLLLLDDLGILNNFLTLALKPSSPPTEPLRYAHTPRSSPAQRHPVHREASRPYGEND